MRKKIAHWLNREITWIAVVALLTFVTFNILFAASRVDDYPRELIAALIGTIMAAVVTQGLLRQQTRSEETKDKNVEIFKLKIKAYDDFLNTAIANTDDDELSDEEVRDLRKQIFRISLLSSRDAVGTAISFVRNHYLDQHDTDRATNVYLVVQAFRTDLALDELDESALEEMALIDQKLTRDGNEPECDQAEERLLAAQDAIGDAVERESKDMSRSVVWGWGNTVSGRALTMDRKPGTFFMVEASCLDEPSATHLTAFFNFSEMKPEVRARLKRMALDLGFLDDCQSPEVVSVYLADVAAEGLTDEELALSIAQFAKAYVELERAADESGKRPSEDA